MEERKDRTLERLRKPFQGVLNIVRFNWQFYVIAAGAILCVYLLSDQLIYQLRLAGLIFCYILLITTIISLIVSFYVYDLSPLYKFKWLQDLAVLPNSRVVNINAGFDEISHLISAELPGSDLIVYDFYDPLKHTEVSIRRARNFYLPFNGTREISTAHIPLPDNCVDLTLVMFAAHEIRQADERIAFFRELNRVLNNDGRIIIVEHMRDALNFTAYNIGFLHFFSRLSWLSTFKHAKLFVEKELNATPFVKIFVLNKNESES